VYLASGDNRIIIPIATGGPEGRARIAGGERPLRAPG
jgi:hypothetical protein